MIRFENLPPTPETHFRLYFYAAVLNLLEGAFAAFGSPAAVFEAFPFLAGYNNELAGYGAGGLELAEAGRAWQAAVKAWEDAARLRLPLRDLRQSAGLEYADLVLLLAIGLVEEDARFGVLYETLHGLAGQHRPTLGLFSAGWRLPGGEGSPRPGLRRLGELGLIHPVNQDAPRLDWAYQAPGPVWEALRGERHARPAPWASYRSPAELIGLDELVLPSALRGTLERLPGLLGDSGEIGTLVARGPQHNGRRTLLGAAARRMGMGILEVQGTGGEPAERWRLVGPLATLLEAMPVLVFDLAPGETAELPILNGYRGPLGVAASRNGGLNGLPAERALTLTVDLPSPEERRKRWQAELGEAAPAALDELAGRFRMTGGNIRSAARLARAHAALDGRRTVVLADVQEACRSLNRQALETLAQLLPVSGDWRQLAASTATMSELAALESRCRYRERLPEMVHPTLGRRLNAGVRALFTGPSGTGKTLAACLLASVLGMDLYRLDLSAVVNKYIGETEKNLAQVFARAEELDVILLLDEGDALLTQRTGVQNSNDRYANLETNYLLQRIETFEGILIVTTNAGERIDSAFQRRMDVVVDFRLPEPSERWAIWQLHLPQVHEVSPALLNEVAGRCALTGGQIRNAVLHASLLALGDGGVITSGYLEAAVQREYTKIGAVCPLRRGKA